MLATLEVKRTTGIAIVAEMVPHGIVEELVFLALYQAGKFPFDKLIKTYRPDQINEAFHDSETGVTLKPVLVY